MKEKETALGIDHLSTLETVTDLYRLYEYNYKDAEAEALYMKALTGKQRLPTGEHWMEWREFLGKEHESTLDLVHTLYANQGKQLEAEAAYKRTLTGRKELLGVEHTSTLDVVHDLGVL